MKRFWLILLSLGLVMAFSVSAFAVDVKISGEYYAAGLYLNNTSLKDQWTATNGRITYSDSPSTAFFYQRLRVGTDFVVSPSLKLVTRFDAMERIWGGARSNPGTTLAADSAETTAENENIAIDWVYINYVAPFGKFDVGIMNYGATGTIFGNSTLPAARIKYYSNTLGGAFNINADYSKISDNSYSAVNNSAVWTDGDKDAYAIEGVYNFKDGKAGLKGIYYRYADKKPQTTVPPPSSSFNYIKEYFLFTPYAIAKVGPVALQAEFNYATGKNKKYDTSSFNDQRLEQISAFVDATATFAPVYVGGTFAFIQGDDPNTGDIAEGGTLTGGNDWNPCLIMFNYYDVAKWVGPITGYESSTVTGPMSNAWFFQGRIGVKPTPQWDAMLSISYATADKKPSGYANGTYGTEVDLTGTYKITNNLSYMLGVGYLFTGDFFKGLDTNATIASTSVRDDFIVINKLTLNF
jgi:hypothetical protein